MIGGGALGVVHLALGVVIGVVIGLVIGVVIGVVIGGGDQGW